MSAVRRLIATVLVLAAIAAAAWYGWRSYDEHATVQSTTDAYVRAEITVLSPRVAGYAVAIEADDDDVVKAKQVLVRIDPRDYRAAVVRAEAALDQAVAGLSQSKAKLQLQASQVAVAQAALDAAKAQDANTTVSLSRARELLSKGAGTQATFDTATATDVSARSAVSSAAAQLDYQRQEIGVLQAGVTVAGAEVEAANAALETSRTALEDTAVWSPVDGTVADRLTRVGEYVSVGTRMLSIVPKDGLWIEAQFRETQLAQMKAGQSAAIALDTFGGRIVCGYVEAVGPAAGSEFALVAPDNATGNFTKIVRRFPVRLRANRTDAGAGLLKPGMSTTVQVSLDDKPVAGCHSDPDRDRQPPSLRRLPAHPGLSESDDPPPTMPAEVRP